MSCGKAWASEQEEDFKEYKRLCKQYGEEPLAKVWHREGWEDHYSLLRKR